MIMTFFIHHFIINILENNENRTFTQSSWHFWNYMVKKLKGDIMAKIIWSKKLKGNIMAKIILSMISPSYLSPMTTAEEGNPFRWTGGMWRRLSQWERLSQYSLQGWICELEIKEILHWWSLWRSLAMLLLFMITTSVMLIKC